MNTREQVLRRRIETLEARNKLLGAILKRALADLEFTESVGAAFAFDLSATLVERMNSESSDPAYNAYDSVAEEALESWNSAVRALESQLEAIHH